MGIGRDNRVIEHRRKFVDVVLSPEYWISMNQLLRQLATFLIVAFVTMGVTASGGSASEALECQLSEASAEATDVRATPSAHKSSDHAHPEADIVEDRLHDGGAEPDFHASHCKAPAGPSITNLGFKELVQAVSASQVIVVNHIESLVALSVPEGLHRPPRA